VRHPGQEQPLAAELLHLRLGLQELQALTALRVLLQQVLLAVHTGGGTGDVAA